MNIGLIPSTSYIDLGAQNISADSSKNYTAPADGFYNVIFKRDPDTNIFGISQIDNVTRHLTITDHIYTTNSNQYNNDTRIMPVLKGDTFRIYVNGKTVTSLRFIYAIGSEPNE